MPTESELYQQFEKWQRNQDEKSDVVVGSKDKGGNLFILGGHKANLWQLANGLFEVAGEKFADDTEAMEAYNQFNSTDLSPEYIRKIFYPWYEKQFHEVTKVPSATSDKEYTIRRGPDGKLECNCLGFRYRHSCWHVDAVLEAEKDYNGQGKKRSA